MPELFDTEKREDVEFDSFDNYSDKSQIFKNSLLRFGDIDNQFFYAVLYGNMHCKLSGRSVELQFAKRVLGTEFFIELKKIEKSKMVDHSIFVFFDRCQVINEEVLSEYGFFLRFYERRTNGLGIEKISEVSDSQEMLKIFQDFYSLTGRLPLSNSLLVVPDGDAPPEEKLNMRHLYDLFKNTNSHGIVSLPFLGLIQFYLEENDNTLIKSSISELYYNLSYMTLSGARDFKFEAVSDLTARLSILLKHATLGNKRLKEIENDHINKKINEERVFQPKTEDPLDDVIEIIDMPDVEHKKSMFPYVEPTVETADKIDKRQEIIDTDFIDLQNEFNKVNEVVTEQKKTKENKSNN